ncbi:MAG TPA: DUF192 domain-containing protein [Moheibacter sp.]|nr:DUF192 domain-containing protein [Moheibacter sp.]
MKKISWVLGILLLMQACEKTESQSVTQDLVEIEFTKEGVLTFSNEEGVALKTIDIEIADNANKRARGLMDRSEMADNQGMLFIFGDDEVRKHTFYMKNTRIPLDILYFDRDSVLINIARNAKPGADSELAGGTVAAAKEDSKFVVEVNGGLAEKWGIEEGVTKINWQRN